MRNASSWRGVGGAAIPSHLIARWGCLLLDALQELLDVFGHVRGERDRHGLQGLATAREATPAAWGMVVGLHMGDAPLAHEDDVVPSGQNVPGSVVAWM